MTEYFYLFDDNMMDNAAKECISSLRILRPTFRRCVYVMNMTLFPRYCNKVTYEWALEPE